MGFLWFFPIKSGQNLALWGTRLQPAAPTSLMTPAAFHVQRDPVLAVPGGWFRWQMAMESDGDDGICSYIGFRDVSYFCDMFILQMAQSKS